METEFNKYNKKYDERDKDFLYQELIDLEESRSSLERRLKELSKIFQNGFISDSEYNDQEKEIKNELTRVSSNIIYLRALIIL